MLNQLDALSTLNKVFAARPTLWVELNRKLPVSEDQKMALLTLMGEQPGIEELFNGEAVNVWGIVQLFCEAAFAKRLGARVHKGTGRVHEFIWQRSHQIAPIQSESMEDGSYDDDMDDDDYDDEEDDD